MQKHVLYNTIKRSKYKEVKYFYSNFKYFQNSVLNKQIS